MHQLTRWQVLCRPSLTLNYRDATRTQHCIDSLIDAGAEAVLVWDNSADGGQSAEELRLSCADQNKVSVIVSTANLGFAAGVNRGIESIRRRWPGAWVFLINNDAVALRPALQMLATALHANRQAVLAYPRINHAGHVASTLHYQRQFGLLSFKNPLPGSFPFPSGAALLIAIDRGELPFLDEDFFMYGEDVMLGWRLGTKRMVHVPQVLIEHEASASARNGSLFYETHMAAGHWLLAYKLSQGLLDQALLLSGRYLSLSARALLRAIRLRSTSPLRGFARGWLIARQRRKRMRLG